MDDSKVFIIGANGQLGTALREKYPKAQSADIEELDITSHESVEKFNWDGIDTIINAAAYTNVDGAESEEGRRLAWKVNAQAVANLSAIASSHNIRLIHISTDYVFDGANANHKEDEDFSPLSVYGASKTAGDIAVSMVKSHYILRTSWVIGEGKNFVRTMLDLGKKGISPTVVSDQIGRLTFTSELVRAINHLLQNQSPFGTYNITNGGDAVSWADITREIFKLAGYDDLSVTDTTTQEYFSNKTGIAPRPLQSTLDLEKIQSTGFESRDWKDDLEKYVKSQKV